MRKLSWVSIRLLFIALFLTFDVLTFAQQPFNKTEFAERRAKLFEKIPDGVAVLFGPRANCIQSSFAKRPISITSQE